MSSKIYIDIFNQRHPAVDLSDYFDFIEQSKLQKSVKFKTANHHILPKWAFPEYKSFAQNPWNKAILTHNDHLIAHFILWKSWREAKNASPLLLMCAKYDVDAITIDSVLSVSQLYAEACESHAKSVTARHTGKYVSDDTRKKISDSNKDNPKKKNYVNVYLIDTGEKAKVTKEEFYTNRNLYKHPSEGKPAWNSGKSYIRDTFVVYLKDTKTKITVTKLEYMQNKHLYDALGNGNKAQTDKVTVTEISSGERVSVSVDEYENNKHLYKFHTSETFWYNNGENQIRLSVTDVVPGGYIRGRLKKNFQYAERTCPHCGTVGKGGVMTRYHFDNCKKKK